MQAWPLAKLSLGSIAGDICRRKEGQNGGEMILHFSMKMDGNCHTVHLMKKNIGAKLVCDFLTEGKKINTVLGGPCYFPLMSFFPRL